MPNALSMMANALMRALRPPDPPGFNIQERGMPVSALWYALERLSPDERRAFDALTKDHPIPVRLHAARRPEDTNSEYDSDTGILINEISSREGAEAAAHELNHYLAEKLLLSMPPGTVEGLIQRLWATTPTIKQRIMEQHREMGSLQGPAPKVEPDDIPEPLDEYLAMLKEYRRVPRGTDDMRGVLTNAARTLYPRGNR